VDGYSGDAVDALMGSTGGYALLNAYFMSFSTIDSDNDAWFHGPCATHGGWWFGHCTCSNLNIADDKAQWTTNCHGTDRNVLTSRMLVKAN